MPIPLQDITTCFVTGSMVVAQSALAPVEASIVKIENKTSFFILSSSCADSPEQGRCQYPDAVVCLRTSYVAPERSYLIISSSVMTPIRAHLICSANRRLFRRLPLPIGHAGLLRLLGGV